MKGVITVGELLGMLADYETDQPVKFALYDQTGEQAERPALAMVVAGKKEPQIVLVTDSKKRGGWRGKPGKGKRKRPHLHYPV